MAARAIVREGDTTSHGGTVLESFPNFNIYGKNASGIGHRGYCPQCRTEFVIVAGAQNVIFMGKNVAVEGMLTSCGAVLIASQSQATVDTDPGAAKRVPGPLSAMIAAGAPLPAVGQHWIGFSLPAEENYADLVCLVNFSDGSLKEVKFGQDGCVRIDAIAEITGVKVELKNDIDVDSSESMTRTLANLIGV
ncbi:PAAR domain-containing protein [Chromobacterium haemolyticum]|uniref:PAAR domain-containing protein n=1 Tax=Chromobacterium fluminis TaxID=3044269 RepID=A0ABX0LDC2_9NEIS|nr:PAAR domain-containing protein [Chromobacterium haemolyticum]NHR05342.1 PAAR domain-containing protein [Chromobacterium haemolyticum]